jgi:hypothetical protein
MSQRYFWIMMAAIIFTAQSQVMAHYPWLKMKTSADGVHHLECYFSDEPAPDKAEFLKYLEKANVVRIERKGEHAAVKLEHTAESVAAVIPEDEVDAVYYLTQDLGVRSRGEASYFVKYTSEAGPGLQAMGWQSLRNQKTGLVVIPKMENGVLKVTVTYDDKPVANAELNFYTQADEHPAATTNDKGVAEFPLSGSTLRALKVKFVDPTAGEVDGKKYTEVRHFMTMTFPEMTYKSIPKTASLPAIPETVTSFGAVVHDGTIYYYGGHTGDAHSYSKEGQAQTLWSLKLGKEQKWTALSTGPGLQGLALVNDGDKLYRIGGFNAKNAAGEKSDLWSQAGVSCYDLKTNTWTEMPPLPEPRSSFDAAVLDHKIYVIGGWNMEGGKDSVWHKTAWVLDLQAEKPTWVALPEQPFERRAISVAAHDGKIFAVGGMQKDGGITSRVSVYDPKTSQWSEGPALIGVGMTGFGTSSFEVDGRLYTSTYDGTLLRLSRDGKSWEQLGYLEHARFFHRMLPVGESELVFLGGSNMSVGKFDEVELIAVPK